MSLSQGGGCRLAPNDIGRVPMSQMGHERILGTQIAMSVLAPKADMPVTYERPGPDLLAILRSTFPTRREGSI